MFERRQEYITEVMQEVVEDYGEKVRESNETNLELKPEYRNGSRL